MSINIWTDSMQHAALLGKPVLFTNWLIQRDIIPDGWYCYDLRGTHKSPSTRTTLVDHAADYHAGTVLSPIPLKHEGTASRRVNGTFYLLGEEMTLEQFCEEHDLAYPQDNREFVLRPASLDEVGLFYSEEKLDEALGTVGHLRMDFGHGEKEFWHTWWPHNEDMPVYLGASDDHLAAGAAVLGNTSAPIGGDNTNSVIAGHRGWKGADYFRHIDRLQVGDTVTLTNLWETLTYTVVDIQVIQPHEVDKIKIQPSRDLLTLISCHPYASGGRQRYVVCCERTG